MSFRSKIAGAFGDVDKKFAVHPLDMGRAIELLKTSVEEGVSLEELLVAVEDYLRREGAGDSHISEQLASIEAKFSNWLS